MYANGDIYEGSWANDVKHGSGTYFYISKVGSKKDEGTRYIVREHSFHRLVL